VTAELFIDEEVHAVVVAEARKRLGQNPDDEIAREVLEEAAQGNCDSFSWWLVLTPYELEKRVGRHL
jgi:hypothetical protein